jgi:hypothetical protein
MSTASGTIARPAPRARPRVLPWIAALIVGAVAVGVLVVGLTRSDQPVVGTAAVAEQENSAAGIMMGDLIRSAELHGFSVAGSSPASSRFIRVAPLAAHAPEGVGSQATEPKPQGYGETFRAEGAGVQEVGVRDPGRLPKRG